MANLIAWLTAGSWKTTALGISTVTAAVASIAGSLAHGTPVDWTTNIAAIAAGLGLIFARDNNKTSTQVGAGK
jgi:hypothetical protein